MDIDSRLQLIKGVAQEVITESELRELNHQAKNLIVKGDLLNGGKVFIQEELNRLSDRRSQLEARLAERRQCLDMRQRSEMTEDSVKTLLGEGQTIFGETLKPYKRKELMKRVVNRIEISDACVRAGIKVGNALQYQHWSSASDAVPQQSRGAIQDKEALQ